MFTQSLQPNSVALPSNKPHPFLQTFILFDTVTNAVETVLLNNPSLDVENSSV
jgi:hypothetical protein